MEVWVFYGVLWYQMLVSKKNGLQSLTGQSYMQ